MPLSGSGASRHCESPSNCVFGGFVHGSTPMSEMHAPPIFAVPAGHPPLSPPPPVSPPEASPPAPLFAPPLLAPFWLFSVSVPPQATERLAIAARARRVV